MMVISLRQFRDKQGFYVDKVKHGEDVLLKASGNFLMKLVPISEDDTLMTKEELFAKIERGLEQVQTGKVVRFDPKKGL